MKILQTMAGARYGGAEAFFERLVPALSRAGVDQKVVIRQDEDRARKLRDGGVEPVQLGFGNRFDIATRLRLRQEIKAYAPDIVLSWMNRATSFCPRGKFKLIGRLGGYYDIKYYKNCDHLVANTQDIADYLIRNGWDEDRVHHLPNFVGSAKMDPVSRQSLYTPANAVVVLALGRLHENKGFDVLLRAVAKVPDIYLWLAGEGQLRGELEALAEKLGMKPRVRFLGWRDDTPALFASANIFVCPSRHEPLGNVVIEAWAQGTPVIATDSLGPGMLIKQGENGLLVPVEDVRALSHAIGQLASDYTYRDALVASGQESFEAGFTEDKVVRDYIAFFEKMAA
ncbi:MAG: glycosyltransferase [Proteobacteria bacterium]|nr:glycosyltransferase [Pseudomonadota bacterium]